MSVRPFSFSNRSRNMMYPQHKRRVRVQAVSGDGDTDSPGGHVWFPPASLGAFICTTTVSTVMLVDPAGNIFLQHTSVRILIHMLAASTQPRPGLYQIRNAGALAISLKFPCLAPSSLSPVCGSLPMLVIAGGMRIGLHVDCYRERTYPCLPQSNMAHTTPTLRIILEILLGAGLCMCK